MFILIYSPNSGYANSVSVKPTKKECLIDIAGQINCDDIHAKAPIDVIYEGLISNGELEWYEGSTTSPPQIIKTLQFIE